MSKHISYVTSAALPMARAGKLSELNMRINFSARRLQYPSSENVWTFPRTVDKAVDIQESLRCGWLELAPVTYKLYWLNS